MLAAWNVWVRTNPGSFRIVRGRTKRKGIEAVLGLELPPTVSMCTALDNYNVLRYLRVLVRSRLAEDAGGGGNADATAVDRFLAALMAWLKLFTKVEKSQSDHARLRGLRAIYMRCGKAAFGGSFGETSKNHDARTHRSLGLLPPALNTVASPRSCATARLRRPRMAPGSTTTTALARSGRS